VRTVRAAGYWASHLTKVRAAVRATRLSKRSMYSSLHHRPPAPTESHADQRDRGAAEPRASLSSKAFLAQCATVFGEV